MSVIDSFLKSIRQKKINEVEHFLESGQSPYQWSSTYEHSSFHYACKYFEKTIFELLIHESLLIEDFTEKWHQKDGGAKGEHPHHMLARNKPSKDIIDAFKVLLNNECVELDLTIFNNDGQTVTDIALDKCSLISEGNDELVALLQSKVFDDPNAEFQEFWQAIDEQNPIKLEAKFKPNFWNLPGPGKSGTCLQHAVYLDNLEFVRYFFQQRNDDQEYDPNITYDSALPPIFIACSNLSKNSLEIVGILLDQEQTRIDMTIQDGNRKKNLLHVLLSDKYEKEGESWPLTKLIYQILNLLIQKRPSQIKELLSKQPQGKNTPLHLACNHKGQELIKILLNHGAEGSLFYANKEGEIPANLMLTETLRYYLDEKLSSEGGLMQKKFKIKWNSENLMPKNVVKETPLPNENEIETGIEDGIEMKPLRKEHATSNSSIESDSERQDMFELEYLAFLSDYHKDLFDHPILSSMIWNKWKKVKTFFWIFSGIKIFQHLVGIAFILMTYGGPMLSPGEINGYPIQKIFKIIFVVGYSLNCLRLLIILGALVRSDSKDWKKNWEMVFTQGEYKLTALIILIVPFMLRLKPEQEWVNPRDLAGMYVLVASFDINLAIRDLLTDRTTAAMITWTEVVFYSMWNFLKVHLIILFGFMLSFYIQFHNKTPNSVKSHNKTANSDGKVIFPVEPSAKNETTNKEEAEEEDAGFDEIYKVPFKIIAMFVGELDYGALPFNTHQIFNYVTFVLFVYLVVLVMMNLLTGVALTDVEELKNESGDRTWHEIMLKINFIDEVCRKFSSTKMLAYPNCKSFAVYPNRKNKIKLTREQEVALALIEISTAEQSIVDAAHKIIQKRHQSEEANVMRELDK